jgi:hypothetical protein
MKRLFLLLLSFLLCINVKAQLNLVKNPSFEQYSLCPNSFDQISYATSWHSIDTNGIVSCASEYCNVCATGGGIGVPSGGDYYQYPRTGNGMAQTAMFFDESYYYPIGRNYMQGQLKNTLENGKPYCVTFYVVLEEKSGNASNNIGAYLDNGSIDSTTLSTCGFPQTQYTPQVEETTIITDTLNWIKVEGSFIANGNEKFITIGNFKDKAHTSYVPFNTTSGVHISFYLVDDVSVIESSIKAYAGNDTTIHIGDSAFIGRTPEIGLECTWHAQGSSTVIGTGAGIWVKPNTTTTYIVSMLLCGATTYDTVTVTVVPVGITPFGYKPHYTVYPNPVKNEVTITAPFTIESVEIVNLLGQTVFSNSYKTKSVTISTNNLSSGIYFFKVNKEFVQKMVKE